MEINIEVLLKILEFYADETNYVGEQPKIMLDKGFMAKDGIKRYNDIKKMNNELSEFNEILNNDINFEEKIKIFNQINKLYDKS